VDEDKPTAIDTHELLWKARRYFWLALLPIVVAVCAAVLYIKISIPLYESGVIITMGDRTQMSQALEPMVRTDRDRESMSDKVSGIRSRVMNRTFLQGISDRLGLAREPEVLLAASSAAKKYPNVSRDEHATRLAVGALARKLTVQPVGATYIQIAAQDPSPAKARRLATAIGEALIEDTRRGTLEEVHARGEFSQDQIAVYTEKVRRSESELRAYQESLIGHDAASGPVAADNLETVRQQVSAAGKEMDQVRGRIESDRQTWTSIAGPRMPVPELRGPGTADGEARLRDMEASYGLAAIQRREGANEAQTWLSQIGVARQDLLSQYERAAEGLGSNASSTARSLAAGMALDRAVLRSLQERQNRLQGLLDGFVNSERSLPREQMELERLRNEVQTNRDLLAALQKEATSTRLSEALESNQLSLRVEIIEPPVLPLAPIWPDRIKIAAAALLIGPLISVGLIIGSERVGAIIRTVEQVEQELGAKVIGTIPRIEGWSRPGSYLANHWAPLSIVTVLLLTALLTGLVTTLNRDRQAAATGSELRR
jgi:succinoglycan biosynthesis transport protein ExoP